MIKLSVKKRLAIFLSCVWIFLWTSWLAIETRNGFDFEWGVFLFLVISPIFISWGIYWVISGFKRDTKTAISKKTYGFLRNAANKASPESEWFISSRISKSESEPLCTTAQNEKPKFQNQEEHEKPKFQNREEYEKWKAEKIRNLSAKQNQDKYDKSKYKVCLNCNKLVDIADGICQCGYNFDSPNLSEIEVVRLKRKRKNKVSGIILFIIGVVFLIKEYFALSVKEPSQIGRTLPDQLAIVLPFLAIIIGIYQLVTGKAPKKPTKSPLDHMFGSKDGEDPDDNISYIFCSSCGKQLFKEMKYKDCPHCGFKLSSLKKIKKIIWLTSSFVVIGILIYFAIQLFVVAKGSLHLAATQGNLNSISVLIKKGKDVNRSTPKGFTPLHAATIGGREEAIKLLLDNGALIDPREKEENRTPLHIATQNGNKRIVELLISRGADINAHAIDNITPLHMAVIISNEEIVELLLKNGADTTILANIRDTQYSPLQLAEIMPNKNIIKLLKKREHQ